MISDPKRIARIGVAIELADGERVMIFSDSPTAEVELETVVESPRGLSGPCVRSPDTATTITITGLRGYTLLAGDAEATTQAIDGVRESIERN